MDKGIAQRVWLWLIAVGVLLPLLPLVLWSFAFQWFFPNLLPTRWSLDTWGSIVSPTSRIGEALLMSLAIALLVVALATVIGLPAARALGLYQFRGRSLIEGLILAPLIVPGLVVTMGMHLFFIRYGLADTFLGVVLIHLVPALPYFVLVMAGVFANYDTALEQTARTLGANTTRTFIHITLPAIAPGLAVAAMFTFLVSWSQYITTLLIGGGRIVTLPMILFPFISAANHSHTAAVSLIFMAPALLVLVFITNMLRGKSALPHGLGRM